MFLLCVQAIKRYSIHSFLFLPVSLLDKTVKRWINWATAFNFLIFLKVRAGNYVLITCCVKKMVSGLLVDADLLLACDCFYVLKRLRFGELDCCVCMVCLTVLWMNCVQDWALIEWVWFCVPRDSGTEEMSSFQGVLVSDQWLQSQFTQVELRTLKSKVKLSAIASIL